MTIEAVSNNSLMVYGKELGNFWYSLDKKDVDCFEYSLYQNMDEFMDWIGNMTTSDVLEATFIDKEVKEKAKELAWF